MRRTAQGDALTVFTLEILRLASLLMTVGDELASPAGQSGARWRVLDVISHGAATAAGIGRALGLSRQGVQRLADLLVRDELATYAENPSHKRAKLLQLTPAGEAALELIRTQQRLWANRVSQPLDEQALLHAAALVKQVQQALLEDGGATE